MAWMEKVGDALVDIGSPLGNSQKMTESGFSDNVSNIVGYSVLQAESMDDAKKLLDGHPNLGWDSACTIEIHESLPMPG